MRILDRYDRCPDTGKVIYPNREEARRVGDRRQAESGLRIKVYTCPHCKGLHLSSHFVNREPGSSAMGAQIPIAEETIMASAPAAPAAQPARTFPADRGITRAILDVITGYTEAKPVRAHTIHGKVIDALGDHKIAAKTIQGTLARLAERGQIGSIGGGLGRERWYYGLKPAASPVRQPATRPAPAVEPASQIVYTVTSGPTTSPLPIAVAPVVEAPAAPPPAVAAPPPAPVSAPVVEPPAQVVELQQQTMEAVALLWRAIERERAAWAAERAALLADRADAWAERERSLLAERDAALELAADYERKLNQARQALG